MRSLWITSSGESIPVPSGLTHYDVAKARGLKQWSALLEGWVRVAGSEQTGWDIEVWNIERDSTLELVEDFVLANNPEDRWIGIDTHKPTPLYFQVRSQDVEAMGLKEAILSRLARTLQHPTMGNSKEGGQEVIETLDQSLPQAIEKHEAGFHFEEGGCFAFAVSLKRILDEMGVGSSIRLLNEGFCHAMVKVGDTLIDHQGAVAESKYKTKPASVQEASNIAILIQGQEKFESDVMWADKIIRDALR